MSVLNLALSNSALAGKAMDDEFEKSMKKCNNMASVRKMAATLEASAARARIPNHIAASHVPSTATVDAAAPSATVVDASADDNVFGFVFATSGIGSKTMYERALFILIGLIYLHSLMLLLVLCVRCRCH